VLPPDVRDDIMGVFTDHHLTMRPRIAPARIRSGFDILTFTCDHIHQRAVELVDLMKCLETTAGSGANGERQFGRGNARAFRLHALFGVLRVEQRNRMGRPEEDRNAIIPSQLS
jgi:hypothetical protein